MADITRIHPLSDFLRNHKTHIARLKETRSPEVLTVNGNASVVVMDAESYQEMRTRLERAELIQAIREGYAAAERGETRPAEESFAEFMSRNGIQG
jgi:PHD/YefM family antitoxin component YafN of YafNO toxin-antitoxin module